MSHFVSESEAEEAARLINESLYIEPDVDNDIDEGVDPSIAG